MKTILILFQFILLEFNTSGSSGNYGNSDTLKIGDYVFGGVVFFLEKDKIHGMVCAKEDQGTGLLYKDEINIIDTNGKKVSVNKATQLCSDYMVTDNGRKYDGWHLPTKDQLFLIYQQKELIEKVSLEHGGSGFRMNNELSPTEFCNSPAWDQEFNYGYQDYDYRKMKFNVRAVREF